MPTPLPVVEGAYWRDIQEQPAAFRRTLQSLPGQGITPEILRQLRTRHTIQRVVLTAMGGSYHALHALHIRLNRAGWFSQMLETSELLAYYSETLGPHTLTVVVSQSGETAEIVRLLECPQLTGPVIAITNTADSTLARATPLTLLTAAGPESSVSCKTYITGLAALHWLGSALLEEDLVNTSRALEQTAEHVETYLQNWRSHVDGMAAQLAGVERFFVTGRGWSLSTAGTGGLLLKESTRVAAEGLSAAALRHGPFESMSDQVLVCLCEGDPHTAALNRRLYDDILPTGARVFWLSPTATEAALRVAAAAPELLPITEILPIQMLSLAIAAQRGEEAGKFRLLTKVTVVE